MPSRPIPIEGTLDLVTPPLAMPAGRAIYSKNYEPVPRGAGRVWGFERYDGRPKPSDASYSYLEFDAGSAAITEGQTVTGQTSGATGKALIDAVVSSGSYGGANATGYLILTTVSGTFQDNEPLQVSAVTKCVANGTAADRGAPTMELDATYFQDAIETARTLIQKPTGSGNILGVWKFKGVRYCFKDSSGVGVMYKATGSGWTAVDLGRSVAFTSGGTYEIVEGDLVTGASSGAFATVRRVILTSGSWAAGTAAGRFILYGQIGTFSGENLDVTAHANSATVATNSTAQTLTAAGTYRFVTHNFYGASNKVRMYGVNGVNPAFEFDGNYFVSIASGMTSDTPTHIGVFKNQLILGFRGGSIQNSSISDPYSISPITGASEIGLGADVTNLLSGWAAALVITSRSQTKILYGNDRDDFVLDDTNDTAGAFADTAQLVGVPLYFDDVGIRRMTPTEAVFGNFNLNTLSRFIQPLLETKRESGVLPCASVVVKRKDQYRLFFDDNSALFVYFGRMAKNQTPCILPVDLGTKVTCICSTVCATGTDANSEVTLFGSDDGYVYEMDAGTSFDGEEIEAFHRLSFASLGRPTQKKAWKGAIVEVDAKPTAEIAVSAEFSYGDPDQVPVGEQEVEIAAGGGIWNQDNWNDFYWSSRYVGRGKVRLRGQGTSCSPVFISKQAYEPPHILHGITYQSAPRGMERV